MSEERLTPQRAAEMLRDDTLILTPPVLDECARIIDAQVQYAGLLQGAAADLVRKLDECEPHVNNAFAMAYGVRGGAYSGPEYGTALGALRAALAKNTREEVPSGEVAPETGGTAPAGVVHEIRTSGVETGTVCGTSLPSQQSEAVPRAPSKCRHPRLTFGSGGFYVMCMECPRSWVAKKLGAPSDADFGYDAASDFLNYGTDVREVLPQVCLASDDAKDAARYRWLRKHLLWVDRDEPGDWTCWIGAKVAPYRSKTESVEELLDALMARFPLDENAICHSNGEKP